MNKNIITLLIIGLTSLYGQNLTIQEARQEFGNTVTTSGVVTTTNLASSGQSDFAIQDETAAIIIYNGDFDAGLSLGDLVTVTGEIINYNGKLEIVPGVETDISIESQGNELPNFQYMTLSGLLTIPESFESELIKVFGVEIVDGVVFFCVVIILTSIFFFHRLIH